MTDLLAEVEAPSDAELISRVRGGDVAAYGQLFTRHKGSANRLARQLVRGSDADDLVAEAFAKVLTVLQSGGGPDVAFRAYLLTAVRRLHVDRVRTAQRVQTTDDLTPFDPGVPFKDTAVAGFESGAAAKAFASLPERWQLVLWHLEVEGQKPADIAPLLGMSANSVSALAYRAREGLRQAFLTMHISDLTETDCRWVNEHLGAFVRKGLSKRDSAKVQGHLDECRRCTGMYLELTEVNDNLAGIIGPLILGAAAGGYLASTGVGSAGVLGVVARLRDFVGANTGAASAAGVTVGIAAAAVAVFTLGTGGGQPEARGPEAPVGVTSTAPSGTSSEVGPSASPARTAAPRVAPAGPLSPVAAPTTPGLATSSATPTETPTAEPTDAAATDVPVSLAGTTVDDDGVHLRAAGSPLPPTVTVLLTSASDGVRFADNGDCLPAEDGRQATCNLTPGGGGPVPGTAVEPDLASFAAELPFNSLTDEPDVDIDVSFVLPAGFRLDDTSGGVVSSFRHVMRQDADIALSIPGTAVRPEGPGDVYRIPATLGITGIAQNRVQDVTYTATGGRFLAGDGTLTPTITRSRGDDLTFQVVPDDPQRPGVGITASLPLPLVDSDPTNDTASVSLAPYDVSLENLRAVTPTADRDGTQRFTATVHGDGFPGDLVYTLLDDPSSDDGAGTALQPTSVDADTVTFTVTGDVDRALAIRAALPSGFTDADPTDNTGHADFTVPRDVDVALSLPSEPLRPGLNDVYSVIPSLTVNGSGSSDVSVVTYQLTGATFTDGSTSTSRTQDDTTPFQIVPDDRARPTVTLTASVAPPFVDTDSTNDSVTVSLQPYDVRLTELAPSTETADEDGIQEFVATVDADGLDGVTYRLQDPTLGDELVGEPRVADGKVTVQARSTGDAHDLALEAVPPPGFTDADSTNNAALARWTPQAPAPLHTDLRLTPLTPDRPVPDSNDGFYHLATTLNVSGDVPPSATLTIAQGSSATFVSVDGCTLTADGKQATCNDLENNTSLELVLGAPTDEATDVTITVSAPALFTENDPGDNSSSITLLPTPRSAVTDVDVALAVGPGPLRPRAGHVYSVPTTVALTGEGADSVSEIDYTLEGGSFVGGGTTTTRPTDLHGARFEIVPDDPVHPVVSMSASVPPAFQDIDPTNDTVDLPLKPWDVSLTDVKPVDAAAHGEQGIQQFTATVADGDVPGLRFELVSAAHGDVLHGTPTVDGDTVTFSVRSEATTAHDVGLQAVLPAGFTDVDLRNNYVTVPWTPATAEDVPADVGLLDLSPRVARPDTGDEYTLTGFVSFEGDLTQVDYTVSGAEFVTSGDCTPTTCTLPATGTPTFRLHRLAGSGSSEVTITAHVPDGFWDTVEGNDSASATLKPYDVSLSGLDAEPGPADEAGNQTFSADLDLDGLEEDVSFAMADGPADARLVHTWVHDGRVTFTVHSDTEADHPVAIRAVLPDGFEDADPENNTATGATFTPRPRTADLRLSAGFTRYEDKQGVIAVAVENAPSSVLTVTLAAHPSVRLTPSDDCSLSDNRRTAYCRASRSGTFTLGIDLPPGQSVSLSVTADGYPDPDSSNNTVTLNGR